MTGFPVAGASLLDEATAAAEAMAMAHRVGKVKSERFFVDERVYPQTLDVMKTRAKYFGFELVVGDFAQADEGEYFGALFQYVGKDGDVQDLQSVIGRLKTKGTIVAVAADIMSLVLLKSPSELGADIALGNTQTIPIYFEGSWITLFWGIEAAGLFWIGRTKGLPMYERISYIVLSLGTLSLFKDWIENLQDFNLHIAFYNVLFLNSLLFSVAIGVISYFNTKYREKSNGIFDYLINILLVLAIYVTFLIEIYNYWELKIFMLSESMDSYSIAIYERIYNMEREIGRAHV